MTYKSDKRSDEAKIYRKMYKLKRWEQRRSLQLAQEPFCRFCARRGDLTAASVADHVVEHRGNEELFWYGELQSLCAPCHSGEKQGDEVRGYSAAVDAQGFPLDDRHPAMRK